MPKVNFRLIWDEDHGKEWRGWYTRHDEIDKDNTVEASLDEGLAGPETGRQEALRLACARFGCAPEEIEVIGGP